MSRQFINLGSVANDKSGTPLRDGGDMINDNFLELYNMSQGGPCTGSKYTEMRAALKYVWLTPVNYNQLYYISKIIAGTPYAGNKLTHTVEISKTTLPGSAGTLVGEKTYHVSNASPKTSPEVHAIASSIAIGGITGFLVIDWGKFILGETYTCANWTEGALMAINTQSAAASTGGGGIEPNPIIQIDAADTVDGSEPIYNINPDADNMLITIDDIVNVVGPVYLKNIHDTYNFRVDSAEDLTIDGNAEIVVAAKKSVEILANVDEFIVKSGEYTLPAP